MASLKGYAEMREKQTADCCTDAQEQCGQAVAADLNPYRRPSLREESEKNACHHREKAEKNDQAAVFFRENPAFDEFIRLIRTGAIQI